MFKNVGKTIRILSVILAILCFVALLALGVFCLLRALADGVDETLKTAGIQGAVICGVAAVIVPWLFFALYGFGLVVTASEKQAEDEKEIKEMLRHALAEGLLSDEIARKTAQAQEKVLGRLQMQAPQTAQNRGTQAPVQRFVTEPVEAPAEEPEKRPAAVPEPVIAESAVEATAAEAPAETEDEIPTIQAEDAATAAETPTPAEAEKKTAPPAPRKTTAPKKATPTATAQPLRPIGHDEETF